MKLTAAFTKGIERLARWGWPSNWHGSVVVSSTDQVYCPIQAATLDTARCRTCERLIDIRTLTDGGGSIELIMCEGDQQSVGS